jgi:hypothetical protein
VEITAGDSLVLDTSDILTQSAEGGGGMIHLKAGRLVDLTNSVVATSVFGSASTSDAGDVEIGTRLRVCSQRGRAGRCFPGCYFEVNGG